VSAASAEFPPDVCSFVLAIVCCVHVATCGVLAVLVLVVRVTCLPAYIPLLLIVESPFVTFAYLLLFAVVSTLVQEAELSGCPELTPCRRAHMCPKFSINAIFTSGAPASARCPPHVAAWHCGLFCTKPRTDLEQRCSYNVSLTRP
jgi:hypothetical protein